MSSSWEVRLAELRLVWVVCGGWRCWGKVEIEGEYFNNFSDSWWEERFLIALFLKLVCSSWRIRCLMLLKFWWFVFPERVSWTRVASTVAWVVLPLLSFTGCIDVCLEKSGGSVKMVFQLVDCCDWVYIYIYIYIYIYTYTCVYVYIYIICVSIYTETSL